MEEGTFGPNDGLAGVGIDAPPAIMGGPDFEAAIDDYLAGVDFSTFVDAPLRWIHHSLLLLLT